MKPEVNGFWAEKARAIVLLAAVLSVGFSWFGGAPKNKKEIPKQSGKTEVTRRAVAEEAVPLQETKLEKLSAARESAPPETLARSESDKAGGKAMSRYAPALQAVKAAGNAKTASRSDPGTVAAARGARVPYAQRSGAVVVPSDESQEAIQRVQRQIEQVIRANEKFKSLHQEQLNEIRRINDQSSFHRRILEEINRHRESSANYKPSDVEEILKQEKLRLIEESTEKNSSFVNNLARLQQEIEPEGAGPDQQVNP